MYLITLYAKVVQTGLISPHFHNSVNPFTVDTAKDIELRVFDLAGGVFYIIF